jgi:DNA modification methylase
MKYSNSKNIYEILQRKSVHPFPARMSPGIALKVVSKIKEPIRVLDPMMGSGTVLAIARSEGHRAFGVDIDPLAVLIAKVWTTSIDVEEVRDKASEVLDRAEKIFRELPKRAAYPPLADSATRQFIRYWFDDYARRQLAALSISISRLHNTPIRNALWCGFSRLIIAKKSGVSLAMDLSHSRPHKSFNRAPVKPFRNFLITVKHVIENCIDKDSAGRGPASTIYEGDARDLPLANNSIDLVLTSPPYLNAIDYIRCSKFSLVWMGYNTTELRQLRAKSIGAEIGNANFEDDSEILKIMKGLKLSPQIGRRNETVIARYISEMRASVQEVARVLKPSSKAIYVVGENTIKGAYIRNSHIMTELADQSGLQLHKRLLRHLPQNSRYLPPPSALKEVNTLSSRMRSEVILEFRKSA